MNDRPSISRWSPNAFTTSAASTTWSPRRGPGGIDNSTFSARRSVDSAWDTSSLYAVIRAFPLLCRARGDIRIHSSSRSSEA